MFFRKRLCLRTKIQELYFHVHIFTNDILFQWLLHKNRFDCCLEKASNGVFDAAYWTSRNCKMGSWFIFLYSERNHNFHCKSLAEKTNLAMPFHFSVNMRLRADKLHRLRMGRLHMLKKQLMLKRRVLVIVSMSTLLIENRHDSLGTPLPSVSECWKDLLLLLQQPQALYFIR